MPITPEEEKQWEHTRLVVQATNLPDIMLHAMLDQVTIPSPFDSILSAEKQRRINKNIWIDEEWNAHRGTHPYSQEQIAAKKQEILTWFSKTKEQQK